ncbi:SAF domain-containing protein [Corynebacterium hindlerae]|uniref:SAF domain-containing protein n=1 Tax=Corynebacterium hindlerae TaxID=699041 RepID=UPI0031B6CC97
MDSFISRIPLSLRHPSWRRSMFIRRLLAAVLLMFGLVLAISEQLRDSHQYVVANSALTPGAIVTESDLTVRTFQQPLGLTSPVLSPADAVGKVIARPLQPGDFLQEKDMLGPELATALGSTSSAMVPITLADPAAAQLAVPGARVSVVSAAQEQSSPMVIAEGATVVFGTAKATDSTDPGTVLLALNTEEAQHVAAASLRLPITIVLKP